MKQWAEQTHPSVGPWGDALRDAVLDGVLLNNCMFLVCGTTATPPAPHVVQATILRAQELVKSLTRLMDTL